jgi:hypothetical protein
VRLWILRNTVDLGTTPSSRDQKISIKLPRAGSFAGLICILRRNISVETGNHFTQSGKVVGWGQRKPMGGPRTHHQTEAHTSGSSQPSSNCVGHTVFRL